MVTREFSESPAQQGNIPAISSVSAGDLLQDGRHQVVSAGARCDKTMNDDDMNAYLNDHMQRLHWNDGDSASGTSQIKAGSKKLGKSLDLIDKATEEVAAGDTDQAREHLMDALKDLRQGRRGIDKGLDNLDPEQQSDNQAQLDIKGGEKETRVGQKEIFKALAALEKGDTEGALDLLNSAYDDVSSGKDQIDQAQRQLRNDGWGIKVPMDNQDQSPNQDAHSGPGASTPDNLMQYAARGPGDASQQGTNAQDILSQLTTPFQDVLNQLPKPQDVLSTLADPQKQIENLFTPPDFKDPASVAKKIFDPLGLF